MTQQHDKVVTTWLQSEAMRHQIFSWPQPPRRRLLLLVPTLAEMMLGLRSLTSVLLRLLTLQGQRVMKSFNKHLRIIHIAPSNVGSISLGAAEFCSTGCFPA